MEQLKVKQPNNFYSKFIQFTSESEHAKPNLKEFTKPVQSNTSLCQSPTKLSQNQFYSNQNSPKSYSNHQQTPFETNINAIKANLQVQLLELISCDAFQPDEKEREEKFNKDEDWKFKKLSFPKEEYYQKKFDRMSRNIINNRENSQQFTNKLFSILQNKDQIVVHTSQNKDLMHISERKDVISLAQWYEDMLNQIHTETIQQQSSSNINNNSSENYSKLFGDLQAIHQACISEIIRQISIQSVERGQLLKKVQENLMALLREAFSRQLDEKYTFQKLVHQEIQGVHRDCVEKIDYYIPLITSLTNQLEKKEAINKRILLEFRYLKKKNHKLEKFLKESRKEYKNLQGDYNKLKRQLDDLKDFHVQQSTKQQEDQQKMSDNYVKQLEQIASQAQFKQEQQMAKMKQQNQMLKEIQVQYENDQKQIHQKYSIKQQEIDEIEEQAQKEEFVTDEVIQDKFDGRYLNIQQPKSEKFITSNSERQIIEIEALDGLRFVLASVGVQVENDLIQRQDVETETRTYFTTSEMDTQTEKAIPKVVLTQQCQTPQEWIKLQDSQSDQEAKNVKQNHGMLFIKEDGLFLKKVQSQITGDNKSLLKIDLQDRIITDSPVGRYMSTPESTNKFNIFMEAISDDKVELKSSDTELNEQDDEDNSINQGHLLDVGNILGPIIERQEEKSSSNKFKQTLENTLKASIEEDISDLHLILYSKQRFVLDVFQKIIDNQLLKDNPYLKYEELKLFIEDSHAFKYEENLRFRNIWNKCKLQLIQYVKSKISLAEKEVEIEEANKNLDFGNNLYEKLIVEYENVLEQISSNSKKIINSTKRISVGAVVPPPNSINSIIFETEDIIEEENDTTHTVKPKKKEDLTTSLQKSLLREESLEVKKTASSIRTNKNKQSSVKKQRVGSQPGLKKQTYSSPQKRQVSQENKTQIKIFNDENVSLDNDSDNEKSQPDKLKGKQKFSKIVNMVMNSKGKSQSTISVQQKNDEPETISDDIIHKQIIQQNSQVADLFKNFRFKKHKLRKKYGLQSSPNQDAAFNFLQNSGYKIMNTLSKKNKAVFTETNTRKYISLIYNDKIKQIKSQDKSNPLYNVAYDFFLNKFGFKKLAEKNLQQFLRSLQYHNHIERVKMFLRFFGIDNEINYDIDDFNFYINCLIQLDENLSQQYQQCSIYSIPKVIELLFKKFENKITIKIINKIKSDIESLKFLTNDSSLKNKLIIDQDQAMQCLLQAKIEEKKVNIIALRPIYLAGDVDNDQVIGYDEFVMLARHIERGMSLLSIMQLFFYNTDLIDEITGEKTMSFQQFAQISVENNLFNFEKQTAYLQDIEEWDQIKNLQILKRHWQQKKDILRLRFVKTQSYKNFYRLMIQKIEDYFQSQVVSQVDAYYYQSKQSLTKLPAITQSSHPSLVELDEQQLPNSSPIPKSQKSSNNLPNQVLQQMDQEEQEKQNVTWLLYKLLEDESKRVIVDPQIESLIPSEFSCVTNVIEKLASDNKFFILSNKSKEPTQPSRN